MSRRDRPSDGADQARALALKIIETCQRSGSDSSVVISALAVTLGMVLGNVAADSEVAEIAVETIYRAIAAGGEDDSAGGLQ
jgi:hypothetical protein